MEQHDVEVEAIDMGIARYRHLRQTNDPSNMTPEQRQIVAAMDTLIPGIEQLQSFITKGGAAPGLTKWGPVLLSLDAERLAMLALSQLINATSLRPAEIAKCCGMIGSAIKKERDHLLVKAEAPDVYKEITQNTKHWDVRALGRAKKLAKNIDFDWPHMIQYWGGYKLLELAIAHTRLFVHDVRRTGRNRTVGFVDLAEDVRKDIEAAHGDIELLSPFYMPMVAPPRRWDSTFGGPFLYNDIPLVKKIQGWGVELVDLPQQIYDSLNLIQDTQWRINAEVLDVMEQVWTNGGGMAGIPLADMPPLPPKPEDIGTNDVARSEWRRAAAIVYDENARQVAKRKGVLHKLAIARRMRNRPCIWFAYQMDWRGRVYPLASHLHPQGDDSARGLLEFADSKPLGDRGWRWLQIHLANCFGIDKVSFDDRVDWVQIHAIELTRCFTDPLANKWWMQADKPFMALAAIMEWGRARKLDDPREYQSHLPVSVDGSCNGLQHYSALGRDPVGAGATNLAPTDTPKDIYGLVADRAHVLMDRDLADGVAIAGAWIAAGVDRSTVKRAVMTTPYGVTKQGIRNQFITDGHTKGMANPQEAATYLRDVVYEAVGEVVIAARDMMDWLREVADITSEAGVPVSWITPIGFPVHHEYQQVRCKEMRTVLQKIYVRDRSKPGDLDTRKQRNGLPPNYVHSLDAAHMMCTTLAAAPLGVTHFAMVHDSYGSHACDVDSLLHATKHTFVEMHSAPLLEQLKQHLEEQTGLTLPELPPQGEFALKQVLHSDYFFA